MIESVHCAKNAEDGLSFLYYLLWSYIQAVGNPEVLAANKTVVIVAVQSREDRKVLRSCEVASHPRPSCPSIRCLQY